MSGRQPIESHRDPRLEAMLRSALEARADAVHPSDRSGEILGLTRVPEPGPRRTRLGGLLLVVGALMVGFLLSFLWPSTPSTDSQDAPTTASTPLGGTASGQSSVPTVQTGIQVFYLGRADGLLYREMRDLPTLGDRLGTAVAAVLNVAPQDPEYTSSWSGGQVNSATVKGNRITLDLSQSAFAQFTSRSQEEKAIQQLVHAATAAVGGSQARTVQILVDGSPNLPLIGKPDTDFVRSGSADLGPLWIDSPQFGQTVAPGPLAVYGTASDSLTSMTWSLHKGEAKAAASTGRVTLGQRVDGREPWNALIRIPRGAGQWRIVVTAGSTSVSRTVTVAG
ncbi:GerMN domain-containing protein [Acidipropionibacterium virtanenii]|uniref:GerMN domain-containing protein n=1 Tax=Acidipropionibacterium virtanenii TaxID=2057246 RepID=A0A344URL3_9ACTN|nr:GerMN domain-containing protein [Acidipropionibacterium virtanenii]AXE37911.1 hypothetical protein JS278_00720 [Acidipropionibacterium virtanenii]